MMGRMLVALWSIALVDHVCGFNPLPSVPVQGAPRVQPQTAPNGVATPTAMQTMPGRPFFLPSTPQGSSGSSFLPPMASFDPALSATLQGQEASPMVTQEVAETTEPVVAMKADEGSWYRGFAGGLFASFSGIAAAFLTLRYSIQRQSSATPQLNAVELRQNPISMALSDPSPLLSGAEPVYTASPGLRGTLQGSLVANFTTDRVAAFDGRASAFTAPMHGIQPMVPSLPLTAVQGSLVNKPGSNGVNGGPLVGTAKQKKQLEKAQEVQRAERRVLKNERDAIKKAARED